MKKLVLHIGLPKTGTSSIQESLGGGAASLAAGGVYYPHEKPYNHSFTFTVLFLDDPHKSFYYQQLAPISDEDWQAELQRLKARWRAFFASAGQGVWIVSAENLGRISPPGLEALKAFVEPYFDAVRVIAYVRDPLQALKSQWEQRVKELREPMSAQALLQLLKQRLHVRFLQHWIATFGVDNFVLRRFDPAGFVGGNLLRDFFHSAGVEPAHALALAEQEANQSLGAQGAALLLALNSRYPMYRDGRLNNERGLSGRQQLFYEVMRQTPTEPLSLDVRFTEEEAAGFNEKIRFLNSLLPADERFQEVAASDEETLLPDADQLPAAYVVELVNNLSKLVDQMADQCDHLQRTLDAVEAQRAELAARCATDLTDQD